MKGKSISIIQKNDGRMNVFECARYRIVSTNFAHVHMCVQCALTQRPPPLQLSPPVVRWFVPSSPWQLVIIIPGECPIGLYMSLPFATCIVPWLNNKSKHPCAEQCAPPDNNHSKNPVYHRSLVSARDNCGAFVRQNTHQICDQWINNNTTAERVTNAGASATIKIAHARQTKPNNCKKRENKIGTRRKRE